jgi:hypothetical protein
MRPLRFYLIPAGYWSTLLFGALWLAFYIKDWELPMLALAVALFAMSIALRAYGDVLELKAGKKTKVRKR